MPSITGGLNGAPAGRFLDVSGWVGVSGRNRTRLRIRGIVGDVPTINTTLGACEGLDVVWPWSSRRGRSVQVKLIKMGGRLVRHARRLIFQLSEVSVP